MKLHLITLVLTAVTLYSCGNTKNGVLSTGATTNAITEGFWELETLEGVMIPKAKSGEQKVGFTFEKDNRITGFGGCNRFFGTYQLEAEDRLNFSAIGSTKMACLVSTFNEADLFKVLDLADSYKITGDKFEIKVGTNEPIAVFKKIASLSETLK